MSERIKYLITLTIGIILLLIGFSLARGDERTDDFRSAAVRAEEKTDSLFGLTDELLNPYDPQPAATPRKKSFLTIFAPDVIEGALSIRTANVQGNPADWELSGGATWGVLNVSAFGERENGLYYWGYGIACLKPITNKWAVELQSNLHEAANIDRQSVTIFRDVGSLDFGGGVTAEAWANADGVFVFKTPLLDYGKLTYLTDFLDVHSVDATIDIKSQNERRYAPFIRGIYRKDGLETWKIKFGVEVTL